MLRVQSLDALSLERPDDGVVGVEHVAEHGVVVMNRRRRPRGASAPYILVRVEIDVLDGWQGQRADLYRFGGRHTRYSSTETRSGPTMSGEPLSSSTSEVMSRVSLRSLARPQSADSPLSSRAEGDREAAPRARQDEPRAEGKHQQSKTTGTTTRRHARSSPPSCYVSVLRGSARVPRDDFPAENPDSRSSISRSPPPWIFLAALVTDFTLVSRANLLRAARRLTSVVRHFLISREFPDVAARRLRFDRLSVCAYAPVPRELSLFWAPAVMHPTGAGTAGW